MRSLVNPGELSGRSFQRIAMLLVWLVILPTLVVAGAGLVAVVGAGGKFGGPLLLLLLTPVACLVIGIVLVLAVLRREARLAELQADFVAKVGHELRTPLTAITMLVDTLLLDRAEGPEETRACLQAVQRETDSLRTHIERLLDWGRIEAGRRRYVLAPVELAGVVDEAVELIAPIVGDRGQELVRPPTPAGLTVVADRQALVEVVTNLLSNASKYSAPGQPIEVGADASGGWARLWVRDRGIGIAAAEHQRIFTRFYRVDDRLTRQTEGSGLGLAIVHHVVRAHRGRIAVESEPGCGATFTIFLPGVGGAA